METPPWIPLNLFWVISVMFKVWKVIRVFREYLFDSGEGEQFPKEVGIYAMSGRWRAPSERIRTASEIPIVVNPTDDGAVPFYVKISEKVVHLRRLGMTYASIADSLGVNLWMTKRAGRWGKTL